MAKTVATHSTDTYINIENVNLLVSTGLTRKSVSILDITFYVGMSMSRIAAMSAKLRCVVINGLMK